MRLWVDGERRDCPEGLSLAQWVEWERIRNPEVAILHVNDRLIPPERWTSTRLREGDRVQLLYFLGDS